MPDRTSSGIDGLDTILAGGFVIGGITIVQGRPGTGKTILGNQMCFNHARAGGRALYVTLLAESHSRMLMHLRDLAFFDASAIPDRVYYVSAFSVLETDGLRGLLTLLRREVRAHSATMLILDGLIAAETIAVSDLQFKKFIHELQIQATVANCTMFLMTSAGDADAEVSAEHTMVDCVIDMRSRLYGWRSERDLEVLKRRGAGYLLGRHALVINDAGIEVHPRFEMTQTRPLGTAQAAGERLSSGLSQLDRMFGGGVPERSMTMLEGPPGAGKTTLGMHFLGPCSAAEPGLLFTTADSPEALLAKARVLGLPVAGLIEAGHVEVVWQSSTEGLLDAAFHRLMHSVRRMGARRLCIDSLAGLLQLAPDRTRLPAVFAALVHELRTLGVTSLFTSEVEDSPAQPGSLSAPGLTHGNLASVADNIVTLQLAERRSSMVRLIAVFKARDAPIDPRPACIRSPAMASTSATCPIARRRRHSVSHPGRHNPRPDGVRTVLVVDDEFGVAEVLDAILTDEGFRVVTATNGRQALARIAEQRPDLVLLDYMMPILDGIGVLHALAADPSADDLPVVVMSALPEEAISDTTHRYRAFLRKPFRIRTVLAAIETAMPAHEH